MTGTMKGGVKAPPIIDKAAYLSALSVAERNAFKGHLAETDPALVGLRKDSDGAAIAAVNQLRARHSPEKVLQATIESVGFASNVRDMEDHLNRERILAEANAADVLRFMQGPAKGYSAQLTFSLEGLYEYWQQQAAGSSTGLKMQGLPRKKVESTLIALALRMLRDSLFPKERAHYQALCRLIETAMGVSISDDLAKEALRQGNSLAARAKKAGLMAPESGDTTERSGIESTLSKKHRKKHRKLKAHRTGRASKQ